ncbi:hypothetical protein ACVWW1_008552 [Bradyrhizobium sp. JR3.5]
MNAIEIDGKVIAGALRERVARDVAFLQAECNVTPGLAVVLIGKDPASSVYVKAKARQARAVGFKSEQFLLPSNVGEPELLGLIEDLNADDSIDGILVQLPLPGHIDRWRVLEAINPAKDVDGFHPYNVGRLAAGRPTLTPCTPLGVIHLIKTVVSDLIGLEVVVIGSLDYRRKASGDSARRCRMYRDGRAASDPKPAGSLSKGRHCCRCRRLRGAGPWGLAQARRNCRRCGHQPFDRFDWNCQTCRRCSFCRSEQARELHNSGAWRRRAHDCRLLAREHR